MPDGQFTSLPIPFKNLNASQIPFDATGTELTSNTVSEAIKELAGDGQLTAQMLDNEVRNRTNADRSLGERMSTAEAALSVIGEQNSLYYQNATVPGDGTVQTILYQKNCPAGVYVVSAWCVFAPSSSGTYRNLAIQVDNDDNIVSTTQVPPCSNATTRIAATAVIKLSQAGRIYCTAAQNSGSSILAYQTHMDIVRIK